MPVGVPAPGALTATEYVTVTAAFWLDGFGVLEFIVVVVLALLTVCDTPADVLPLNLVSPL